MAKTSYLTIPDGLDTKYFTALQSGNRFIVPHVKVKRLFSSRSRKKGLTQKSLLVSLSPVWQSFTDAERLAWNNAGAVSSMSGFKLFVQDTSHRIANDLPGYATPNILYQSMVGRMTVETPATGLTIVQLHPQTYYVNRKVTGTRSQYEPVVVREDITLPIVISISYKSALVALGTDSKARFFVIVYSNYQGQTIENTCEIVFDFSADWKRATATLSNVVGQFRGYTAFVEMFNSTGTLLFDNVSIVHGGLNWARDTFCNNIQQSFTKAFYQIPKNWAGQNLTTGNFFRSVYHEIV